MADLSSLIRLHKHELDEKRRALAELYAKLAELERERRELERTFEREMEAIKNGDNIHYTFAPYAEKMKQQQNNLDQRMVKLEKQVEAAKDDMMVTFGELKKYEMTQAERDRLAEEERMIKETRALDEIALQGYVRRSEDAS